MDYLKRAQKFRAKKRLGQNFLVDENVINFIIEKANLSKDDTVLEIGPGLGFVTEQLANEAQMVIAVEIDKDAIKKLNELPFKNINIIENDILKTQISDYTDKEIKVIANIPYYITSPILVHLLGEMDDLSNLNRTQINEIILMVQYEVAQRIVANEKSPNKQYGTLSILANYWCETEMLLKVPAKSFFPAPKVDSALIRLKIRKEPIVKVKSPKSLRKIVQACFNLRRKTIKNALQIAGYESELVAKALSQSNIEEKRRGETLSIKEFAKLCDVMEALNVRN